ncbi:flowering time control protein FPA [Spinacia oleracea]|uniref:Flowering time control protein FPA n=1 Tax=Spinacia oleracea TaxID=3562 RepID=A0A9R0J8Y5_SPIOL|nr:flowering time control protein FPA [Spinacia oleracea]XP_021863406.1 flowering time control protein FPA [Spinacia oleracea]XP_021863407.1 flowering time control protein FPA [Spinacia oleracea]
MKPKKYATDTDSSSSHLWVGNLPPDVTESELTELFDKHGLLDGITCYATRSYAFVYYKRAEDAASAKEALQGFLINGNSIKIEFAKPAKPSKHVWVGGFGSSVTKEMLEEELSKFGLIEDLKFIRDRNTALVDFARLEDASAAVKNMNGLQIGDDRIRVDFLRSHPAKRDHSDFHDTGSAQFKGMGGFDPSWNPDNTRNYNEPTYPGQKRMQPSQPIGGRKGGHPSKVLWVGYPPSVVIDEEMLNNAMILHGEIERIKCFAGRHYSFVEFRSVEEARRAKDALQGRLFNDPRISIMFSNSDTAPGKDFGPPFPGFRGQRPDMFGNNEFPFGPPFMDGFPSNRAMPPNSFHGPHAPNGMLGPGMPRPFGPRGSMDPLLPNPDFHDPNMLSTMSEMTANAPVNQRQLSPSAAGLLPPPAYPGRASYKTTGWDVLDPNQPRRESKRSRIGDEYIASDQSYSSGPPDMGAAKGNAMGRASEDYIWRGVIAKGGNPVCHARCIPMGKGLECEVPEVVNCSARTGLDMLAKHYAGAIGFDIVFFLPDSEDDFANYTEFLRYLGSKNRAGVAKLDDGTTLFLVPPSDFLTDVLKVTGPERLYGVVLKLPQQLSGGPSLPQPGHPPLPPIQQTENQLGPPSHEYIAPEKEFVAHMDYGRAVHDDAALHSRASFSNASVSQDHSNEGVPSTPRPAVTLTPELIATLHAFLPPNSQSSVAQSAQPQLSTSTTAHSHPHSTNEKGVFSQGWSQQPQVTDATGQSQQFGGQGYSNAPLSSNFQSYASNLSMGSHPIPVPSANMQMQNPVYNFQEQGSVSSRPPGNHPVTAQSQQFVPAMQNMHHYHPEAPHNIQKGYGMVHGAPAGPYGTADSQQHTDPGSYSNQVGGSNLSRPQITSTGNMNSESQNPPERTQTLPSGVGQGSSEVEVDKNQRYQSTLQFAASLLLQIQQQQQQQQASPHMGNQQ